MRLLSLAAVVSVALAGCGSIAGGSGPGRATVWVTRDRGAHVLRIARVPAGLTAMQGLERVATVKTRYGGRYVSSVDGLGEQGRRSWFYYVNGYLADRGAADYRLRGGDIEWWDLRSWRNPAQDPLVVGAFPEPFLHGYDGRRRPAVVVDSSPGPAARAVARRLHARVISVGAEVPQNANVLYLGSASTTRFEGTFRQEGAPPGWPVRMVYLGDWHRLVRERWPYRFRYAVGR